MLHHHRRFAAAIIATLLAFSAITSTAAGAAAGPGGHAATLGPMAHPAQIPAATHYSPPSWARVPHNRQMPRSIRIALARRQQARLQAIDRTAMRHASTLDLATGVESGAPTMVPFRRAIHRVWGSPIPILGKAGPARMTTAQLFGARPWAKGGRLNPATCGSVDWALPYLNRLDAWAQGCTYDGRHVGSITLGSPDIPTTLDLTTANCINITSGSLAGKCVYIMEADITIPNGASLTVEPGVTIIDANDAYTGAKGNQCWNYESAAGTIHVLPGGTLTLKAGSAINISDYESPNASQYRGSIDVAGGTLNIEGTSAQPVTLTTVPGIASFWQSQAANCDTGHNTSINWGDLTIHPGGDGTDSTASVSYLNLNDAGDGTGNGIYVNSLNTTIQNSTISQVNGNGIESYGFDSTPTLTSDTIENNGVNLHPTSFTSEPDYGLYYDNPPTDLTNVNDLTLAGNGHDQVGVSTANYGAYEGTGTWQNVGGPTTIPIVVGADGGGSSLFVSSYNQHCPCNLTVALGTTLEFNTGVGLNVGVYGSNASLTIGPAVSSSMSLPSGARPASSASGPIQPVILTSAEATPAPGDWAGVSYDDQTNSGVSTSLSINDAQITYASTGLNQYNGGGNDAIVENTTISNSSNDGIKVQTTPSGGVTAAGDTLQYNDWPIEYTGVPTDLTDLSALAISHNTNNGVGIDLGSYGAYSGTGTWTNPGAPSSNVPIVLGADETGGRLDIAGYGSSCPCDLTVAAGTLLEFNTGTTLRVGYYSSQASLAVNGTSAAPVTLFGYQRPSAHTAGEWGGIQYDDTAGTASTPSQLTLTYTKILYATAGFSQINGGGQDANISHTTISNASGDGVDMSTPISAGVSMTNDTISNNQGWAMYYAVQGGGGELPTSLTDLTNLTVSGNGHDAIGMNTGGYGTYSGIGTWHNPGTPGHGVPLVVDDSNGAATRMDVSGYGGSCPCDLTIAAGTTVEFNGVTLRVGQYGPNASLNVAGTAVSPVTLTSSKAPGSRSPGDWGGIDYADSSDGTHPTAVTISYADIEYAGTGFNQYGGNGGGANAAITNSTIANSAADGVDISTPIYDGVTMTGDTISNNAGWAMYYNDQGGNGSEPTNLTSLSNLTVNGNGHDAIGIGTGGYGTYSGVGTWKNAGAGGTTIPYVVDGTNGAGRMDISGYGGSCPCSLTVSAGTTVEFLGATLRVGTYGGSSALHLNGTLANAVVLTSASSTPAAGDWSGVNLHNGATLTAKYAQILYGGNCVTEDGASTATISASTIGRCSNDDVNASGGSTTTVVYSTVGPVSSGQDAVRTDGTGTTTATHDWWGNKGPYNGASNASGNSATPVSNGVTFKPWLTLTVHPNSGAQGSQTTVAGNAFKPSESVAILWNCTSLFCSSGTTLLATATAGSNGSFSQTVNVPTGQTVSQTYSVGAIGQSSGGFSVATFKVTS